MTWREIDGWLSEQEGAELRRLAAGQLVLEIGSFRGRSTCCMAEVANLVVGVDPHTALTFGGKWHAQDSLAECRRNVAAAGVESRVVLIPSPIELVAPCLVAQFGLVFVDGDHSEAACFRDLEIAYALLKRPGTIAVHDYHSGQKHLAEVTVAVDRWRQDRPVRKVGSLAIFEIAK